VASGAAPRHASGEQTASEAEPATAAAAEPADLPVSDSPSTAEPPAVDQDHDVQPLTGITPIELIGVGYDRDRLLQSAWISGKRYAQAMCIAASPDEQTAQITFSLKGEWLRLDGTVGITGARGDGTAAESESPQAVFRIYGDANLIWESGQLTGAGASERFEVEVAQLDIVALVVESQGTRDDARPVWADMQLVRGQTRRTLQDGGPSER
jgi:hypothetical protein